MPTAADRGRVAVTPRYIMMALHHDAAMPDAIGYRDICWRGVMGHRQVTDAYLAALARHFGGKLASLDRGLVALHGDVAVLIHSQASCNRAR